MGFGLLKDLEKDKKTEIFNQLTQGHELIHFSEDANSGKFAYAINDFKKKIITAFINDGSEALGSEKIIFNNIESFDNRFFRGNSYSLVENKADATGINTKDIYENGQKIDLGTNSEFLSLRFSNSGEVNILITELDLGYKTINFKAGEGYKKLVDKNLKTGHLLMNNIFINNLARDDNIVNNELTVSAVDSVITRTRDPIDGIKIRKNFKLLVPMDFLLKKLNLKEISNPYLNVLRGLDKKYYIILTNLKLKGFGKISYVFNEALEKIGEIDDTALYEKLFCISKKGEIWTTNDRDFSLKINGTNAAFSNTSTSATCYRKIKGVKVLAENIKKGEYRFYNPEGSEPITLNESEGHLHEYVADRSGNVFSMFKVLKKLNGGIAKSEDQGDFVIYKNSQKIFDSTKMFAQELLSGYGKTARGFEIDSNGNVSISIIMANQTIGFSKTSIFTVLKISEDGSYSFKFNDGKTYFSDPAKTNGLVPIDISTDSNTVLLGGQKYRKKLLFK